MFVGIFAFQLGNSQWEQSSQSDRGTPPLRPAPLKAKKNKTKTRPRLLFFCSDHYHRFSFLFLFCFCFFGSISIDPHFYRWWWRGVVDDMSFYKDRLYICIHPFFARENDVSVCECVCVCVCVSVWSDWCGKGEPTARETETERELKKKRKKKRPNEPMKSLETRGISNARWSQQGELEWERERERERESSPIKFISSTDRHSVSRDVCRVAAPRWRWRP